MISYSKVKDYFIEKSKRIIKVNQFGAKTSKVASDYGDDSQPLKDMTAIYADTSVDSEPVIIGYINTNQISKEGEKRLFSQKTNGSISFYIHLKNDGTCEINGKDDNAVRFNPLKSGIDSKDDLINAELSKISTAISSLGGSYVPSNLSTNISNAKIDDIKTS